LRDEFHDYSSLVEEVGRAAGRTLNRVVRQVHQSDPIPQVLHDAFEVAQGLDYGSDEAVYLQRARYYRAVGEDLSFSRTLRLAERSSEVDFEQFMFALNDLGLEPVASQYSAMPAGVEAVRDAIRDVTAVFVLLGRSEPDRRSLEISSFNARFGETLRLNRISPRNAKESDLARLIGMLEERVERARASQGLSGGRR
jgi:hypothetical protein